MASSTTDCSVCVFASQVRHKRTEEQTDDLIINVRLLTGETSYNPTASMFKNLSRFPWSSTKTFNYSRGTFCSMSESEQHEFALTMIKDLEIPFPMENIHWSLNFPTDKDTSHYKLENIDQAVSRLLDVARNCASEQGNGHLQIRIAKLQKLSLEEYTKNSSTTSSTTTCVAKGPLDDWIEENKNDLNAETTRQIIFRMHQKSPKDHPYFGLKSVMVKNETWEQDREEPCCCAICKTDMKKGKQVIQLPCSHMFHGVCIFNWFRKKKTCPLCRFKLFNPDQVRNRLY